MGKFYEEAAAESAVAQPLEYIKIGSASDGGATSLSLTVPADVQNNDLCLIAVIMRNGTVSSPPEGSGWTLDYSYDVDTNEWVYLYSKVSNGTEPASWPITTTSTTCLAVAGVVRGFIGAATAKRYEATLDAFTVAQIPGRAGELCVCLCSQAFQAGASGIQIPSNGDWGDFLDEVIAAVNANDQAASLSLQVFGSGGGSVGFTYETGYTTDFVHGLAIAYGTT
jgi:hypothetical protein